MRGRTGVRQPINLPICPFCIPDQSCDNQALYDSRCRSSCVKSYGDRAEAFQICERDCFKVLRALAVFVQHRNLSPLREHCRLEST